MERDVRQLVRRGYDQAADWYLATRTMAGADVALLGRLAARLAPGSAVLDAGCGAGQPVSEELRRSGFSVTGLDISRPQLELGRAAGALEAAVQGDLAALPFPGEAFAGVVSYYAIFHLPREEHATVFAELRRVLGAGGSALLCLGNRDLPEDRDPDSWLGQPMYWSQYDGATNLRLVEAAGFAVGWHTEVVDPMGHGSHLFVLLQARA